MELGLILTMLGCFGACIATTITMFIWATNRTEEGRKENMQLIQRISDKIEASNERWEKESRDFHGRLCAIEEERTRRLFLQK